MTLTTSNPKPWHVVAKSDGTHIIKNANGADVATLKEWQDAEFICQQVNSTGRGTTIKLAE
jgi:hypothetical protein